MAGSVDIYVALRNIRQFVTDAKEAARGVTGIGDATKDAGSKAKTGWSSVAKWAGGAAVIAGTGAFLKSAVGQTQTLARETMGLTRTTGLSTEAGSQWIGVLKSRGIETGKFQVGITKLSRQIDKARTGTEQERKTIEGLNAAIKQVSATGGKDAPKQIGKLQDAIARAGAKGAASRATLDRLGLSLDTISKGSTEDVLLGTADAFQKMTDPAEKVALAQQLFGKSGQALLPVLNQGRTGVERLLAEQKASGNYLTGKGLKDQQAYIQAQRELGIAFQGLKVQVGVALMPVLVKFGQILVGVAKFLRPVTSNAKAMQIIVGVLTGLFVAYTLTMKIAAIANALFGATMAAWPIFLIIAGIIALVAVFVILYKKVDWFRAAADAALNAVLTAAQFVWNWIKANWPYLLGMLAGPFGLAVVVIVKNFDTIKAAAVAVFDKLKAVAATIAAPFQKAFGLVTSAIKTTINTLIRGWNSLQFKVPGVNKGPVKFGGFTLGVPKIPELATGGLVTRSGLFQVGEAGPELVALPVGAAVTPAGGPLEIVVPLVVDGRQLARAVARVTSDQLARR